MKKVIISLLAVVGALAIVFILFMVGTIWVMNSESMKDKLLGQATELLSEKLETQVGIDSVRVGLTDGIRLFGVAIEDQHQRKMLQIDQMDAKVGMTKLLNKEVSVDKLEISGVKVHLYNPSPDSIPNYQFLLDLFKPNENKVKTPKDDSAKVSTLSNFKNLSVHDVEVIYNDMPFHLQHLEYKRYKDGIMVHAEQVSAQFERESKKGPVATEMMVGCLTYMESGDVRQLTVDSLRYKTDNHKLHKRSGRPKRGYFDAGHLDVVANLRMSILQADKDSLVAVITQGDVNDQASGLHVTDLRCKLRSHDGKVHLSNATIGMANTSLSFADADLVLPNKKKGTTLQYSTSTLMGKVLLADIAQPFAPVLHTFMEPLNLAARMSGDDKQITFQNIFVGTTDNQLKIRAAGQLHGLDSALAFKAHFDVYSMMASVGMPERIISQFPVKKYMMEQLHELGNTYYTGNFDLLWKKEVFRGLLRTQVGSMNFDFALDEKNKYVYGEVETDSFMLGQAIKMPDVGKIACKADFQFDISRPRTALVRTKKGGKLPIGRVNAEVSEVKYKFVKFHNVAAHINSDGVVANGGINVRGKFLDMLCNFSFTSTTEMEKMKIKPGMHFHKLTEGAKAENEAEKQEEKEAWQQQAGEKELRGQDFAAAEAAALSGSPAETSGKEQKRRQKAAERERRRQQKAAEKEQKKRQKEQAEG